VLTCIRFWGCSDTTHLQKQLGFCGNHPVS
jgi:hypothetical protein